MGLLDIAQCLNDAISKLEKINYSKGNNTSEEGLKQAVNQQGAQRAQGAALQVLLGPLMAQAFGNKRPRHFGRRFVFRHILFRQVRAGLVGAGRLLLGLRVNHLPGVVPRHQWAFFRPLVSTIYRAMDLAIRAAVQAFGTAIFDVFKQAFLRPLISTAHHVYALAI